MKPEKIVSALETTIIRVTKDIKKKQGNTGSDKLDSLAKLVNSYSRQPELGIASSCSNHNTA